MLTGYAILTVVDELVEYILAVPINVHMLILSVQFHPKIHKKFIKNMFSYHPSILFRIHMH